VNRVASVAETGAADPVLRAFRPLMPAGAERYAASHAALIASLPAGQHVVLAGPHAMNQEPPAEVAEAIISLLARP
jgi:hypothetical protein